MFFKITTDLNVLFFGFRVLAGKKTPSGKGYYDESGKWVRTYVVNVETKQSETMFSFFFFSVAAKTDLTGRDGFGQDFIVAKEIVPPTVNPDVSKLRCDICQVSVTSLQQIEMHYKGQKHKKKIKLLGLEPPEEELNVSSSSSNDGALFLKTNKLILA